MKKILKEIRNRWKSETPKFFKNIVKIGLSISGIALAMHLAVLGAGAEEPQWWVDVYPYIIAIPAGMAATAKLTIKHKDDESK